MKDASVVLVIRTSPFAKDGIRSFTFTKTWASAPVVTQLTESMGMEITSPAIADGLT